MSAPSPRPWLIKTEGSFDYIVDAAGKKIGVLYGTFAQKSANAGLLIDAINAAPSPAGSEAA